MIWVLFGLVVCRVVHQVWCARGCERVFVVVDDYCFDALRFDVDFDYMVY